MTLRLYYADSYLQTFTAHVDELSADGMRVYLDRTAFYPTSGGQPHDTGTLGSHRVVDVMDETDRIAHLLAEPAGDELRPGAMVEGRIDWSRRFDQMQQHTGQHLLSAVALARFGWRTVSVHFGDETATLDFAAAEPPAGGLAEIEIAANEAVTENRPIRVSFEEAESVSGLRRPSKRTGTLRVVSIEGLDRSACGGTHLAATGEIGAILLRRLDRVREGVRLEFVCGARAVRRARADFEALSRIAHSLSASLDGVPDVVTSQTAQLGDAIGERKRLRKALADARARSLADAATPNEAGVCWLVLRGGGGLTLEELRDLASAVAALPRAALIASCEHHPTVIVAAAAGSGVDAGRLLREALAAAGGRGGGSATLAQGSAPSPSAASAVVDSLATIVGATRSS